jgi:hypothetical protein
LSRAAASTTACCALTRRSLSAVGAVVGLTLDAVSVLLDDAIAPLAQ